MKPNARVILAIVKKDILGLLPLILLSCVVFVVVPIISNLDLMGIGGDQEFWLLLQANIYWVGFFLGLFLIVSALQLDPADSLNHDWLTRPIARLDWLLAKLLFLLLVFALPVILSRLIADVSAGVSPGIALYYAAGIESFEATTLASVLIIVGLLAPTLRKSILLMIGVFFIFLLPGWSVTSPILAAVGIRLGGDFDALMWVQGTVIVVAGFVGFGLIYWFLYCKRQRRRAYLAFWSANALVFLSIYPPDALYNWDSAIAINTALINTDNSELDNQVILEPAMACFPAAMIDDEFPTDEQSDHLAQARWPELYLTAAGPNAMSIATSIRYRDMLDEWYSLESEERERTSKWRLHRFRSQARIDSDSLETPVELQYATSAQNRYDPIVSTKTDYWLIPGDAVKQLAEGMRPTLTLEYDAVLLKPTPYELPVDGVRRRFPELGYCKAELDSGANEITVECRKRGTQPDLVSAELVGIESSRVDSLTRTILTSDWIEQLKRNSYELTLQPASIADNSSVIVTAYKTERILNKQLTFPGVLGDIESVCPLPNRPTRGVERPSSWSDKSPHEISFVSTEQGVRIEVLDWRQKIKPDAATLMLLPGLGATAHAFDDVAEKLAQKYNVVGMTRRGTGDSSKPDRGYEIERLAEDVLQVMDALELSSVVLLGHSFGGEELSFLGSRYPSRIDGLIYADAAYDRVDIFEKSSTQRFRELSVQLPQAPPVRPSESKSYATLADYARRLGRSANIPEGEIIASYDMSTGQVKHERLFLDALMRGIVAPDYKNIKVPALALYAVPGSPEALNEAWYDQDDPNLQPILEELFEITRKRNMAQVRRFETEVPNGRAIVLEDADHWIFLSNEEEVLQAIDEFIESLE